MEANLFQRMEDGENREGKNRLESYFQTMVESLPGGVAVVRCKKDGLLLLEFFTDRFAAMVEMTREQVWELYKQDALAGVHPDDRQKISQSIADYLQNGQDHCEMIYRLLKGDGSYIWVKNTWSSIRYGDDVCYIYAVYHDVTKEREKQEQLRKKYHELILRHYQTPTADTMILGHCNITRGIMSEIIDYTSLNLTNAHAVRRDDFFSRLAEMLAYSPELRQNHE